MISALFIDRIIVRKNVCLCDYVLRTCDRNSVASKSLRVYKRMGLSTRLFGRATIERIVVYCWYLGNVCSNRSSETFYPRSEYIHRFGGTVVAKEVLCRGSPCLERGKAEANSWHGCSCSATNVRTCTSTHTHTHTELVHVNFRKTLYSSRVSIYRSFQK